MIPNIFISSTIDDLRYLRDALRDAVLELAYHPVMSEHGEVGYLNPITAAESCYKSVQHCQIAVVIVGRRYGTPDTSSGISVTHKEFRTARDHGIPLIAFVESQVMNYKEVYAANPDPNTWKSFPQMDHPELTFGMIDEITSSATYNGLIPFTHATDAKQSLKLQVAYFVGESLSEIISPMRTEIKDVLAEIKTLRHELTDKIELDPNFLTTLRFIIDDSRNSGLRYLIEHTIGPIDKAIPILLGSKTFEEFIEKTGHKLTVQNDFEMTKDGKPHLGMMGAMQFGVPAPKEEKGFAMANFATFKDQRIVMNEAAKGHFDWLIHELKMKVGTDRDGNAPFGEPPQQQNKD